MNESDDLVRWLTYENNSTEIYGNPSVAIALMIALAVVVTIGVVCSILASFFLLRCAMSPKMRLFCMTIVMCDLAILICSYFGTYLLSDALFVWTQGRFFLSLHLTSDTFCKLRSYLFFTLQFCSNHIVLLLAVERFVAVHRPFLAQRFGIRMTWISILTVIVVAHIYHIWCYKVSGLVRRWDETGKKCMPKIDTLEGLIAFGVFAVVDALVPSCVSAGLNTLVAIKVWKCFKQRQQMSWMPNLSKFRRLTISGDAAGKQYDTAFGEVRSNFYGRELRTTITLVICSFIQCGLYLTAGVSWLVYSFHHYEHALEKDSHFAAQLTLSSRLTLAFGCIPHVAKPILILKRVLRYRTAMNITHKTSVVSMATVYQNEVKRRLTATDLAASE